MHQFNKILFAHFGTDGGTERFFVNLARGFGERGIEQKFIIRPHRTWRKEIEPFGEIIEHRYRRIAISSLFLKARVKKLVKQWQPDVMMGFRPRAARLIPDMAGPLKVARMGDFPKKLKNFKKCDVLIGNVPQITQRFKELGWQKHVCTISNFPRDSAPQPVQRAQFNTPQNAFLTIGVGRFVRDKGFHTLIQALAKITDMHLWLVGDGPELETLKGLARHLSMTDRVHFLGWQARPQDYLVVGNAFCLPSCSEPLGNVVLEAFQAKLPVVATRTVGPSWFMEHDKSGYMVEIGDADDIARGLLRIRDDQNYAHKISLGGQQVLQDRFSKQAIMDQYIDLFEYHLNPLKTGHTAKV